MMTTTHEVPRGNMKTRRNRENVKPHLIGQFIMHIHINHSESSNHKSSYISVLTWHLCTYTNLRSVRISQCWKSLAVNGHSDLLDGRLSHSS